MAYYKILLSDLVEELGEDRALSILSTFSCPFNQDIEDFLRKKSIQFYKQGIAATHLIFTEYKEEKVLVGYFAISSSKEVSVKKEKLSSNMRSRIKKFSTFDSENNTYSTVMPLIGQLSKNFSNNYDKLISGDVLLSMALNIVEEIQRLGGGRFVYLECEENQQLIDFYKRNGFYEFGKRALERDEDIPGHFLVQMLRYVEQKKK